MIIEGLVTSTNAEGQVNLAPMGPIVEDGMQRLIFRPFRTSRTYRNLKEHPAGVFHVTDDVLLLAKAAVGLLESLPGLLPAHAVAGSILASTCQWYEFEVESLDDSDERTRIEARVVHQGRMRDFVGFNRGQFAVLEAAILATRLHLIPQSEILAEFDRLAILVEKTGGPREHEAFSLLRNYCATHETQNRNQR